MLKKLETFFKKINYQPTISFFDIVNIKTEQIEIDNNFQLNLFLTFNNYLPIEEIENFENHLSKFNDFIINVKYEIITNKELELSYFSQLFIYILKKNKFSINAFSSEDFKFENDLYYISIHSQRDLVNLNKNSNLIFNNLIKYGIKENIVKNIKLIIKSHSHLNKAKEEKINQIKETKIASNFNNGFSNKRFNHKTNSLVSCNQANTDINLLKTTVSIEGQIAEIIYRTPKHYHIYTFLISDFEDAINCIYFYDEKQTELRPQYLKVNDYVIFTGRLEFSKLDSHSIQLAINSFKVVNDDSRLLIKDEAKEKRVELHTHSKMSTMDGVTGIDDYILQAYNWNHKAIAITDHNNVHAYPLAYNTAKKLNDFKIIYGVEFNFYNDESLTIIDKEVDNTFFDQQYVFFDLETTGLHPKYGEIIEFCGIKMEGRKQVETLQFFIKTKNLIPGFISKLTNITNEQVQNEGIDIEVGLKKIKQFIKNTILVAHNAEFDISWLAYFFEKYKMGLLTNPIIDTMKLSWVANPTLKNHRLGTIAKFYNVAYDEESAHRADFDTMVLSRIYFLMINNLIETKQIQNLNELYFSFQNEIRANIFTRHLTVLAKNNKGIKLIFELVSLANTKYYNSKRKIASLPKSEITKRRENLLIGSTCYNSEIWLETANDTRRIKQVYDYYDYLEIQPPSCYLHLVQKNELTQDNVIENIKEIIKNGKKYKKIVVASSDTHYLRKEEKIIRDIYVIQKGVGGVTHPLYNFKEKYEIPNNHFRTTNEMLSEFSFLQDKELIKQIVIDNTNQIASQIEKTKPIKDKLYPPIIDDVDNKLFAIAKKNLHQIYGENPNQEILSRYQKEYDSITKHKFSIVYYISYQLVHKSLEDGYIVGSRGSVGSSFIAFLTKITEVNPLPSHYFCLDCYYFEWVTNVDCGFDLEEKKCPNCKKLLKSDGHDIPFETFLGFEGDKIPDIDLNFSSEYQQTIHNYAKKIFGDKKVFRAGTISTVAQKTAYGYVANYVENVLKEEFNNYPKAKRNWLTSKVTSVKRTTGQHPGGLILIPNNHDVHDFTAYNYPADDITSEWYTTHFDFESIHDNLLKIDALGHQDPSAIRMLQDLTKIDPFLIPNHDQKVISLFFSLESLKIKSEDFFGETTGAIGIPEFGTDFVRKMLSEAKPKTFADLVRISGLSHGTDVWLNNARNQIIDNNKTLKDIIACRDDIMVFLLKQNIDPKLSFMIMESVRKGKGLRLEWEKIMIEHNVPNWYIDSCKKIKYMFPKAHATAYVYNAWRIAWFKLYYPLEYYATYFTLRCEQFGIKTIVKGKEAIYNEIIHLKKITHVNAKISATVKERNLLISFESIYEMLLRGFKIENISLEKSQIATWIIDYENNSLIPPFNIVDGLGDIVAKNIVEMRTQFAFKSIEDFRKRTNVNNTQFANLESLGVFKNLSKSTQLFLNELF